MPLMPKPDPRASAASIRVGQELQTVAAELSARLNGIAGQDVAWSLFVWTDGRASYIAHADRAQVIGVLEHMIARWKQGMPDIPAHEIS